jgi:hypothetical protein
MRSVYRPVQVCVAVLLAFLALWAGPSQADAAAFAFPEMPGWSPVAAPQSFSSETLYEYINGAADLYLTYEFQDLSVAEYQGPQKGSVTVEVYRHGTPTEAFGIYSQERLANARFLEVGVQAYYEPGVFNFLLGPHYVKIGGEGLGADDEQVLLAFARRLEARLGGKGGFPTILSAFPAEGRRSHTEKFVSKNFLGYAFLHSGFTVGYEAAGKRFTLFAIEGTDREDCRRMLERYAAQLKQSAGSIAEGTLRLKDPYHGDLDLVWKGSRIWGVMGLDDRETRSRYLILLGKSGQ